MKLEKARFLNSKLTILELTLKKANNKTVKARIEAPADYAKGKNQYFDMVLEKYDLETLKEESRKILESSVKKQEWELARRQQADKGNMLNQLFKQKVEFLNTKIMQDSSIEQRRSIRKANTPEKLMLIKSEIIREYADKNNISFYEAVSIIDVPIDIESDETDSNE